MSAAFVANLSEPKSLPPFAREEKLPPLPPADKGDLPPPPPIKVNVERAGFSGAAAHNAGRPALLPTVPSLSAFDDGLSVPVTPVTPAMPSPTSGSGSGADGKSKKVNPLVDLIDTEKQYVDQLTGVIRKVAAAWSRSNLPPPELDSMFRSIEGVYKANRSLFSKLKDIGTNPSSPKALGDLLMRWIDDLDAPYTAYCEKYRAGFDSWDPVCSNSRLPGIIEAFSAACPPPAGVVLDSPNPDTPIWTLDALFLLPKGRLKYYRKLYNRLLKSTAPGRSDHKLLVGAIDKLDGLLGTLEDRSGISVSGGPSDTTKSPQVEDEVVFDLRTQSVLAAATEKLLLADNEPVKSNPAESVSSSVRGSSASEGGRLSRETAQTSISRGSTATISQPISDLERRLSTDRCIDVFTMKPKVVRLQICPPSLTFTRELRMSADVTIRITPRATGQEIIHRHGHIFLLSDLFLVCERMTPSEMARAGPQGADMWLLYPPLAGKVLRVSDVPEQSSALQIAIMRKENLHIQTNSIEIRDALIREFKECVEFAGSVGPVSKEAPPPLPTLPSLVKSSISKYNLPSPPMPSQPSPERSSGSMSPPRERTSSPLSGASLMRKLDDSRSDTDTLQSPPLSSSSIPSLPSTSPLSPGMTRSISSTMSHPQGGHSPPGMQRAQSAGRGGPPNPMGLPSNAFGHGQVLPRSPPYDQPGGQPLPPSGSGGRMPPPSIDGRGPPPPSYGVGQVIPPPRSASMGSSGPEPSTSPPPPPPPQSFRPGGPFGPNNGGPPNFHRPLQGPPGPNQFRPDNFGPPPMNNFNPNAGPNGPFPPRPQGGPPHPGPPGMRPSGPHSRPPSGGGPGNFQSGPPPGGPQGMYQGGPPGRPPSAPGYPPNGPPFNDVRKVPSTRSLNAQYQRQPGPPPPQVPQFAGNRPPHKGFGSSDAIHAPQARALLPSAQMRAGNMSTANSFTEPSPPNSPVQETPRQQGPVSSVVSAQMKCKVFLKQQHAQWKSLGSAKLKLYREQPTNVKQLVVESDSKSQSILISTIVLTDGVERVGKTGVAVELSDRGSRTGIVYMIQLRNEESAGGLFESLLIGSDRAH